MPPPHMDGRWGSGLDPPTCSESGVIWLETEMKADSGGIESGPSKPSPLQPHKAFCHCCLPSGHVSIF